MAVRGLCFGRSSRLLKAASFQEVFDRNSQRASSRELLCLGRPNESGIHRLGLVIAKKHVRLAVQRNRVKRIIRDSFRTHRHLFPPMDIVILARPGLAALSRQALHQELLLLWQKLGRTNSSKE